MPHVQPNFVVHQDNTPHPSRVATGCDTHLPSALLNSLTLLLTSPTVSHPLLDAGPGRRSVHITACLTAGSWPPRQCPLPGSSTPRPEPSETPPPEGSLAACRARDGIGGRPGYWVCETSFGWVGE